MCVYVCVFTIKQMQQAPDGVINSLINIFMYFKQVRTRIQLSVYTSWKSIYKLKKRRRRGTGHAGISRTCMSMCACIHTYIHTYTSATSSWTQKWQGSIWAREIHTISRKCAYVWIRTRTGASVHAYIHTHVQSAVEERSDDEEVSQQERIMWKKQENVLKIMFDRYVCMCVYSTYTGSSQRERHVQKPENVLRIMFSAATQKLSSVNTIYNWCV
jgi:hypothetical protein